MYVHIYIYIVYTSLLSVVDVMLVVCIVWGRVMVGKCGLIKDEIGSRDNNEDKTNTSELPIIPDAVISSSISLLYPLIKAKPHLFITRM